MLRFFVILIMVGVFITACSQKEVTPQQQPTENSNSFFPVTQYLLGQLKELENLPVTPLKITSINGRTTDSIWLKREQIRSIAQPFLTPVIDSGRWNKYFAEKSFLDQTINAITLSYDPIVELPDSLELRRWDVYIDPATNTVKRIYVVKQLSSDPPQTIQLIWKQGHYYKITTITEKTGAPLQIKEEQLIWNFNE